MDNKDVVPFTHAIDKKKFQLFEIDKCTDSYLHGIERDEFFEIIWFEHSDSHTDATPGQKYVYLIPPFRSLGISLENKKGFLIAFTREYLEEDDKEYALDVFKLFNLQGQYSLIQLDEVTNFNLEHVYKLLMFECYNTIGTYLAIKALLKVFLLHLIRLKQRAFLSQDINQKRVYQFCILLDKNYHKERKASFYSNQLQISEKRLNQILQEKMHKTITQLIHA
ncbi:MAG: AraC family transcriptional regulator, partial [Flavobacterium sp.]